MPFRRSATLVLVAVAAACGGCTTFNDRFYVPGRDPMLAFLGSEYETDQMRWPAAELPYLRPMRTTLIPDRNSPPFWGTLGWLPVQGSSTGWPPL